MFLHLSNMFFQNRFHEKNVKQDYAPLCYAIKKVLWVERFIFPPKSLTKKRNELFKFCIWTTKTKEVVASILERQTFRSIWQMQLNKSWGFRSDAHLGQCCVQLKDLAFSFYLPHTNLTGEIHRAAGEALQSEAAVEVPLWTAPYLLKRQLLQKKSCITTRLLHFLLLFWRRLLYLVFG